LEHAVPQPDVAPGQRFEELALPHLDAAANLARWLVRDPALADDVVQDAMLRALTYFPTFRGGSARAWLLRIVRNAAYDRLAEQQGRGAREVAIDGGADDPALDVPDPGAGPEAAMSGRQDRVRLRRALDALPVEQRECLILRELEELSYQEIVRVTGAPIGTVMSRLWRARQALLRMPATVSP
jgi:RNA polymerase sigma-70 factor (ECF subfamily)